MKNKVSNTEDNKTSNNDFNMIPVKYRQNAGTKKIETKKNEIDNTLNNKAGSPASIGGHTLVFSLFYFEGGLSRNNQKRSVS